MTVIISLQTLNTISLDNNQAPENCIKIVEKTLEKNVLGRAGITMSGYEITYPLTIYIDQSEHKKVFDLESVVKHELLHTLGLADMYDEKYKDETIMYYAITEKKDLSQSDVEIINRLYSNKLTHKNFTVETSIYAPTVFTFNQIKEKEEDEEDLTI